MVKRSKYSAKTLRFTVVNHSKFTVVNHSKFLAGMPSDIDLMATVNSNWLALSAKLIILQVRESASSRRSQEWLSPRLLALVANCVNALNAYLHRRITLPLES